MKRPILIQPDELEAMEKEREELFWSLMKAQNALITALQIIRALAQERHK